MVFCYIWNKNVCTLLKKKMALRFDIVDLKYHKVVSLLSIYIVKYTEQTWAPIYITNDTER